jgi:hypothetical protein
VTTLSDAISANPVPTIVTTVVPDACWERGHSDDTSGVAEASAENPAPRSVTALLLSTTLGDEEEVDGDGDGDGDAEGRGAIDETLVREL